MSDKTGQIDSLLEIMAALRDPEKGCPWDIEQTFKTISAYTIEEMDDFIKKSFIIFLQP